MLNERRRTRSASARISATVLAVVMLIPGCSRPAVRDDPGELRNHPVDGIVGFGQGIDNEMLFALRDGRRFAWSDAPVIRVPVPGPGSVRFRARGSTDPNHRPLVVLVRALAGERPHTTASLLEVGPDPAGGPDLTDANVRPCLEESWISAFFIAGLGPVPRGAVTVEYIVAGSTYRMRVDPEVHTVHATPALQLTPRDIDGDAPPPEKRVMSFQPSYTVMPVLPLVVWREERRWSVAAGTGRGGNLGVIMDSYAIKGPPQEWRFYMLEAPPLCQKEER